MDDTSIPMSPREAFSCLAAAESQLQCADRRGQLLQLAHQKLSAAREQQRQLSDAHLEARMRKERTQFDADRWATLAKRCREAATTVDKIGDVGAADAVRYILLDRLLSATTCVGVAGTDGVHDNDAPTQSQGDPLVAHRNAVEGAIRSVEGETEAVRVQLVGPVEALLAAAVEQRHNAIGDVEALQVRVSRVSALLQERDTARDNVAKVHADGVDAERAQAAVKQALAVQCDEFTNQQSDHRRLVEALRRATSEHHDDQTPQLQSAPPSSTMELPLSLGAFHAALMGSALPVGHHGGIVSKMEDGKSGEGSSSWYVQELDSIHQLVASTRATEIQITELRQQYSVVAEVEMEQRRLAELEATRDATREAYDALCRRRDYFDAIQSATMTQAAIHSTDVNIAAVQGAYRGLPTLEEITNTVMPTLERQVISLSDELSAARNDLYLLEDDLVVSRCAELKETLNMYNTTVIPDRTRRVLALRSQRLESQRAVEVWYDEEAPRHEAFLDQLQHDKREWRHAVSKARGEHEAVQRTVALAEERSASHLERRAAMAAERRRWEYDDKTPPVVGLVTAAPHATLVGDDESGDVDNQWAEIVDARGVVCKRVRVPAAVWTPIDAITAGAAAHPPSSLSGGAAAVSVYPPAVAPLQTDVVKGGHDAHVGNRRLIGGLWSSLGLLRRGLVELVRGKPVVVPGGGITLSLDV